jgi:uncharacterized protein (TIGR02266 family)
VAGRGSSVESPTAISENALVDSNTRQAKRTPVTLKVKFKSETLDQFIERYAVDVSQGGIFIRTKEPQPVGTQMKFEFQLRDGAPLIGGEGTVVWIRELDPTRPAVAPGMGVRFDRLSEGSNVVLERILTQKSRQTSTSRVAQNKPPAFNEIPTRVAQMPMGDDDRDQTTPLPSPMPFHSDADEFPDEAFEEATKVRSVEELVAQTAMGGSLGAMPSLSDLPLPPPRQGSSPRIGPAFSGRASSPPAAAPAYHPPAASDKRGVAASPGHAVVGNLASGVIAEPPSRNAENEQSLRTLIEAVPPPPRQPVGDAAGRTLIDAAPPPPSVLAQAALTSLAPSPSGSSAGIAPPPASARDDSRPRALESITSAITPSVSVASQAAAHAGSIPASVSAAAGRGEPPRTREPSRPPATAAPLPNTPMVARPAQSESKMTMLIVALVCVLAAAVALVWLLVIKQSPDAPAVTPGSGAGSAAGSAIVKPGGPEAQPGSGSAATQPGTASAPGTEAGSGAGTTAPNALPAGSELAETTIEADYPGVTVEVQGSDQRGKAPLVAKLSKGKSYTVKVSAPGYVTSELTVIGGNDNKIPVKLDPKPHVITVTSTPSSASVYIDGNPIKRMTPASIDLAKAQHGKKLRVMVRKVGFQPFFVTVKPEDFTEEPDRMVFSVNAAMTAAARVPAGGREPAAGGDGSEGTGGEATEPKEPAEPKPAEPKPAEPKPDPAAGKPADPAAGSAEPAPDWTK